MHAKPSTSMRNPERWFQIGALSTLSLLAAPASAEEPDPRSHRLTVGGGVVSAAQLERGYSPLIFAGPLAAAELTYHRGRGGRENLFRLGFSSGALQNRHGRSLDTLTLRFLVVNLFPIGDDSPFRVGFSNDNQFNSRNIQGFINFTGRSDYFTSFGPAATFDHDFAVFGQTFSFNALGHIQLLGFYLPSGYVSSLPRGFGYEPGGFVGSLLGSSFLFHPGSAISLGLRPELEWSWRPSSSLVVSYNYDLVALRHVHPSRRSQGHLLLSLRVDL